MRVVQRRRGRKEMPVLFMAAMDQSLAAGVSFSTASLSTAPLWPENTRSPCSRCLGIHTTHDTHTLCTCGGVTVQDCMHRIGETFNKEFEEVARLKLAEIARIREKNVRISKIIQQLQLTEQLVQPTLQSEEQPEEMLTVQVTHTTLFSMLLPV